LETSRVEHRGRKGYITAEGALDADQRFFGQRRLETVLPLAQIWKSVFGHEGAKRLRWLAAASEPPISAAES
jgi:hypothetical protein